ncbi:MAG: lipoyl(octanoyl) transferase LipB [Crocinitomicaceae bacterium]|nr:MAG: lipoyl(octanoyl) transferase LipB [Crocinitomicaceae bacterium]
MKNVIYRNLGLIDYKEAWVLQEAIFASNVQRKIDLRKELETPPTENHVLFCQHPHVYTLGKSGSIDNLLLDEQGLAAHEATFYKINRGGDITYHGPGQLVVYPILDLDYFFTDIHKYMRYLEEAVILTLAEYGISGERYDGFTGVWIEPNSEKARKICAMGVKCSRWVTMHGIGFNINSDLNYFNHIVPCGIDDKAVTSMQQELGRSLDFEEVAQVFKQKLATQFGFHYV